MFKKRITPFACVVVSMLVCITTVVATLSISSVDDKKEVNDNRLESAELSKYQDLIKLIGNDKSRYEKLSTLIALIESSYVHDYEEDAVWNNIYTALAASLGDDYSYYLTAEEYNALIDSGDGDFVGIGVHATYDVDSQGIYIFGVIPNSPAEEVGLENGDIIVKAEGIEASESTYYDVLNSIRGEAGTKVNVTVLRGEEEIDFVITRQAVASENVLYQKLDGNIAYIRILSFADTRVSDEFVQKIALAQSEKCEKFIFDVRNNSGGYLDQILKVLDVILPEGPIINVVYKNGKTETQNSDANCIQGKMAVLCNGNTASAAELFTAALRDYKLADIVGETTFGKGTMQTTRMLSDGSAIKLSIAFYNPPSNVSYDKIGVKPDFEIKLDEYWENRYFKMPIEEDTQLQKAIESLNK